MSEAFEEYLGPEDGKRFAELLSLRQQLADAQRERDAAKAELDKLKIELKTATYDYNMIEEEMVRWRDDADAMRAVVAAAQEWVEFIDDFELRGNTSIPASQLLIKAVDAYNARHGQGEKTWPTT